MDRMLECQVENRRLKKCYVHAQIRALIVEGVLSKKVCPPQRWEVAEAAT